MKSNNVLFTLDHILEIKKHYAPLPNRFAVATKLVSFALIAILLTLFLATGVAIVQTIESGFSAWSIIIPTIFIGAIILAFVITKRWTIPREEMITERNRIGYWFIYTRFQAPDGTWHKRCAFAESLHGSELYVAVEPGTDHTYQVQSLKGAWSRMPSTSVYIPTVATRAPILRTNTRDSGPHDEIDTQRPLWKLTCLTPTSGRDGTILPRVAVTDNEGQCITFYVWTLIDVHDRVQEIFRERDDMWECASGYWDRIIQEALRLVCPPYDQDDVEPSMLTDAQSEAHQLTSMLHDLLGRVTHSTLNLSASVRQGVRDDGSYRAISHAQMRACINAHDALKVLVPQVDPELTEWVNVFRNELEKKTSDTCDISHDSGAKDERRL